MKKLISLITMLLLTFITSCESNNNNSNPLAGTYWEYEHTNSLTGDKYIDYLDFTGSNSVIYGSTYGNWTASGTYTVSNNIVNFSVKSNSGNVVLYKATFTDRTLILEGKDAIGKFKDTFFKK